MATERGAVRGDLQAAAARIRAMSPAEVDAARPVDSSAEVEMPSNPRNLRTAMESALAISGPVTFEGVHIGSVPHSALGIVPPLIAVAAITTKTTTNTSSTARTMRSAS